MDVAELERWFAARPQWLQDALRRVVEKGRLSEEDYEELLLICKAEAMHRPISFRGFPAGAFLTRESTRTLRLTSIGDVSGVNALSPSKPLKFGTAPLSIVYGRNGAGKSGYVRLLKHACGAKKCSELYGNVFDTAAKSRQAQLAYVLDGAEKTQPWTGSALPDLQGVDIYDTACGLVYVNDENEVTFEPWTLRIFTQLTQICEEVNRRLQEEIRSSKSAKPQMPPELQSTAAATWYSGLTAGVSLEQVDAAANWTTADESALTEKNKRLAETDPASQAAALRGEQATITNLRSSLMKHFVDAAEVRCGEYFVLKRQADAKRQASRIDAEKVFAEAPLQGVGTDSWKLLWGAARKYSVEQAYKDDEFPNTGADARCVLCQRELDEPSRKRFASFEAFVRGELERDAREAEEELDKAAGPFRDQQDMKSLAVTLEASRIRDDAVRQRILGFVESISTRKQTVLSSAELEEIAALPNDDCLGILQGLATKAEQAAAQAEQDARGQNRPQLLQESRELSARKWLHEQKTAIGAEIARLAASEGLNAAAALTATTALSKRKSLLADEFLTKAYVQRFQEELGRLNAEHLRVSLKKTRASVGKVYHKLVLENAHKDIKTAEVLSEGEFRIVSLAAFLADAEGGGTQTPFIFDDPISSLDHIYEDRTAQRLVELSKSRQVVVFTHRLSLVGLLQKYATKGSMTPEVICLSQYVIGDIADLPINLKKTDGAVNALLNDQLPKVKKGLLEGDETYYREATVLSHDIRILMERVVECDLLNDVIKRFSQEVNTKGRIQALSQITDADCKLIDDLLTKYSTYEHSQPEEAPTTLPKPDEFESDLIQIRDLILRLKTRNKG